MKSIRHTLLLWLLPGLGILWGTAGTAIYLTVESGLQTQLDSELSALSHAARFTARPPGSGPPVEKMKDWAMAAFNDPDGEIYFQIWNRDGGFRAKSRSLGELELKLPDSISEHGDFYDATLADGTNLRLWASKVPFSPRGRGGRGGFRGGPPWERLEESSRGANDELRGLQDFLTGRPAPSPDRDQNRDGDGRRGDRDRGRENGPGRRGPEIVSLVVAKDRTSVDRTLGTLLGGIAISGILAAVASVLLVRIALQSGLRPLQSVGERASQIDARNLQTRFITDGLPEELQPIAAKLNDLMSRLEAGFERERRFSADLAHELRTPVAELKSMAEVAIKWPEQASDDNYDDVREISDRMQSTIENLLTLARLEKAQATTTKEKIQLADLCDSQWKPFSKKAKDRKLTVNFDLGKNASIESDPKLLGIIVTNLLSNAAEYAPEKSEVTVSGSGGTNGTILSVRNLAPDLGAKDTDHLFERLWRKDSSRTDGSHSGLGLALAQSCAQVLNLELKADLQNDALTVRIVRA